MNKQELAKLEKDIREKLMEKLLQPLDNLVEKAMAKVSLVDQDLVAMGVDAALGGAAKAGRKAGSRGPRVVVDDATVEKVLGAIKKNDGLKSGEIKAELPNIDGKLVVKAIKKLKEDGAIKMKGEKASATYTAK